MFRLIGWTETPRLEVTACITDAVVGLGGFVLESQRFSNMALMLRFQIPVEKSDEFVEALRHCGLNLDEESEAPLEGAAKVRHEQGTELHGTVFIRFVHDEPELRIETPAVPG
jgi:hypothetical protein